MTVPSISGAVYPIGTSLAVYDLFDRIAAQDRTSRRDACYGAALADFRDEAFSGALQAPVVKLFHIALHIKISSCLCTCEIVASCKRIKRGCHDRQAILYR